MRTRKNPFFGRSSGPYVEAPLSMRVSAGPTSVLRLSFCGRGCPYVEKPLSMLVSAGEIAFLPKKVVLIWKKFTEKVIAFPVANTKNE